MFIFNNLNFKRKSSSIKISYNKKFSSINKRFFSLVLTNKKLQQAKDKVSYRFYDSPDFQPKKQNCLVNTIKPSFISKINEFGDLPSVLIKDSKWFLYWSDLISYWKKKNFIFLSRNLANLSMLSMGAININNYLKLPLGISYSNFWAIVGLRLGCNKNGYKWLTIFPKDGFMIADDDFKRLFKTDVQILLLKGLSAQFIVLVRTNFSLSEFCLYGFKCQLEDDLHLSGYLTVYRESKKKWVWLPTELTDFIYFVHNHNKRCVYYKSIGGRIKKIGKLNFELLKNTLPVKVRKSSGFESII